MITAVRTSRNPRFAKKPLYAVVFDTTSETCIVLPFAEVPRRLEKLFVNTERSLCDKEAAWLNATIAANEENGGSFLSPITGQVLRVEPVEYEDA